MVIYEKFIGRERDSYKDLQDLRDNYKITYPETFNFAYDVLDVLAEEQPNARAMVWLSNEKEEKIFTFKDMKYWSDKTANYLKSQGIVKGDRVLLVLKRSYYFWFTMLALSKIGAIAVQATNMLVGKDYTYRCNKGGIKAVIITGDGDCTEHFDEVAKDCETVTLKFVTKHKKPVGGGWIDFEEGLDKAEEKWERPCGKDAVCAKDIMLMSFSSGTTGYPKMILHNHTYPLGHIVTGIFWHRVVKGGLHFTISDTGWLKSLWGKFYGQWFGESAVLVYDFDKFDGEDILGVLEKYKVTTFCVPPTMYRFMLQYDVGKYDLSSLTHCCAAGEALNPDIFNKWKEYTGLSIHEGFGQTETTCCLGTLFRYGEPLSGFIGKPTPGYDVHVLNAEGQDCAAGESGEICIKATLKNKPCGLMCGYYNDEEATEYGFRGGYFHTGDTAYINEHGFIKYIGRNDDVIKSSGYRIGPFEVESVMMEHPAVLEVAVTGVPDPKRGFKVKATVVLNKGYTGSDELVLELQNYVKTHTAPYKYPRVIEFVESLPKTISGKIRRTEIREKDSVKYQG
ncbi:MAG: AMP-binding protein [Clostridia bacterium]|nr:AMP-binding protein [Clostridia bacterium]